MTKARDEFAAGLGRLAREAGTRDTLRAFTALHDAALEDGELSRRDKELMALAIAIATSCEGCIAWHVAGALSAGASRAQVAEAIGVAIMMGGGPATYYGSHAIQQLDEAAP